jgi:hypothetical protein
VTHPNIDRARARRGFIVADILNAGVPEGASLAVTPAADGAIV